jgi:subtilisin-like proprotein convertase family protein
MQDVATGLVWSQRFLAATGSTWSYSAAAGHATNLVEGGQDDWRLPTAAELQEAAAHGVLNHVDADLFVTNQLVGFWSSDAYKSKGSSGHVAVELFDGTTLNTSDLSIMDAIAVRGTRATSSYTTPNIRVFSELAYAPENPNQSLARVTVALDTQPTANVQIPVSVSDPAQINSLTINGLSANTLTFTPANWNVPQGILVSVNDDALYNPDHEFTIVLDAATGSDPNYAGLNADDATVVVRDNEQAIVFAAPADRTVSEAGDTGYFQVRLGAQPQGTVYVQMDSLDTTEGTVSPAVLTFTPENWNVLQQVNVFGVNDDLVDGDQTFLVHASIRSDSSPEFLVGAPTRDLSFTCLDDDSILQSYSTGTVNRAIPNPGTLTTPIQVPVPGDGFTQIGDLNVTININHPRDSDLTATLIGPDGRRLALFWRVDVSGANFTNTTFDDEASVSISNGTAPYTGSFQPVGRLDSTHTAATLADWDGMAAAGTWQLEITEAQKTSNTDKGTLVSWSLNFTRIAPPPAAATTETANDTALLLILMTDPSAATKRK